jgi:hypothetical protein
MPSKKPAAPKTAEEVVRELYPDYRVIPRKSSGSASRSVDLLDSPEADAVAPALTVLRRKAAREFADSAVRQVEAETDLLGNSSELVTIEPSTPIDNPVSRRERRTVVVSHGKIVGEQG